ncbi:hypothetical protein ECG_01148 [Echinococcus granulosus]|uniref:Secreted protein n=1 Tax=Echinococcus granulosus TaxID=6210 RepID=A0A068W7Z3_ECHGR|nr:hypothetical protein ECG_01148 [Echinococcus granulosus]CDS15960.1 hypothetical protein EgrG_000837100 [Echinococcus granulosus]
MFPTFLHTLSISLLPLLNSDSAIYLDLQFSPSLLNSTYAWPVSGHHLVPTNVDLHCFLFIPASRFTTSGIILLDLHLWVCGSYRYYSFLSDARVCSFCQLSNVSVSLPCPHDPYCLEALLKSLTLLQLLGLPLFYPLKLDSEFTAI